jgi:hypothetical protein
MATTFSGTLEVAFALQVVDAGTVTTVTDRVSAGVGGFDAITKTYTNGTGSGAAQKLYYTEASILTTADSDIDLQNLTNRLGVAVSFTNIKGVVLVFDTPATTKKVVFQGSVVTNPVGLWKDDETTDEDIHDVCVRLNSVDGWTVDGTHKVIRLHNPGLTTVTYRICVWGS